MGLCTSLKEVDRARRGCFCVLGPLHCTWTAMSNECERRKVRDSTVMEACRSAMEEARLRRQTRSREAKVQARGIDCVAFILSHHLQLLLLLFLLLLLLLQLLAIVNLRHAPCSRHARQIAAFPRSNDVTHSYRNAQYL